MKRWLLLLLAFAFGFPVWGMQPIKIQDKTKEYEVFSSCQRLVFNPDSDPGIEEVLSKDWPSIEKNWAIKRSLKSTYYLKTTVQNELDLQLIAHIYYVSLHRVDFYQVVDGQIVKSAKLGIFSDQRKFPFLHSYPIFELDPVTTGKPFDIVVRIEGVRTAFIPWFISAIKPSIEMRHYQDFFYGLVYGLLLLIITYNISLYYRLREIDNLVYALWVLLLSLYLAFFNGFFYEFLLPNPQEKVHLVDMVGTMTGILHIIFAVTFLKIKLNRSAGKVAIVIILWYALSFLSSALQLPEEFARYTDLALIVPVEGIFCLVVGIAALVKGFKPALYFVLSNILFFVFVGAVVSYSTGISGHSFIGFHGIQIGSALEVLFFSFGLSYKVRLLKQDKDKALHEKAELAMENEKIVRDQNISLEQKVTERTKELQEEQRRSDNLLLNILPEQTANELKETGKSLAKRHEIVTILFADFVGFTIISENLPPEEMIKILDTYFRMFDELTEHYEIEKIKTIGDAYMAAGGIPIPTDDSVKNTVLAALEMQYFIGKRKVEMNKVGKPAFEMRMGIHTGPVVAGIVGVKKFQYDIWGDTVNTASRMESSGEVGKVNISKATYELLEDDPDFIFENRGKIEAKGKGEMDMYFVKLK